MAGWNEFDYPFRVQHLQRTRSTVNQNTGAVVAPSASTSDITGDFQQNPFEDETRVAGALIEVGDAIFYTSADLVVGDQLLISHDLTDTKQTLWRVKGVESDFEWIHQAEGTEPVHGFVLTRVEED